jgi:hypothetical protein
MHGILQDGVNCKLRLQFSGMLGGRHFDTIVVMEAESQALLNTLTEHDFQDPFESNGRSTGNGAHVRKGTIANNMSP